MDRTPRPTYGRRVMNTFDGEQPQKTSPDHTTVHEAAPPFTVSIETPPGVTATPLEMGDDDGTSERIQLTTRFVNRDGQPWIPGYVPGTTTVDVSGADVTTSLELAADVGSVSGQVVGADGEPLGDATVSVGEVTTTADADGRFTLERVPSGEGLVVTAAKAGYLDTSSASITVEHSQTTSGVRIVLPLRVAVVNGGFETAGAGGDASAEGWTLDSDPAGAATRQDRDPFGGTIEGRYGASFWSASAYTASASQAIAAESPGTYTVRAYSYSGVTGTLTMRVKDADGQVIAEKELAQSSSPQPVELSADITTASFTVSFDVAGAAGDWAVIDLVEVGYLGEPEPEPDTALPDASIVSPTDGAVLSPARAGTVKATASDSGLLEAVSADLYDAKNKKLVAAIGSTSPDGALAVAEWSGEWALPAKLADGTYTIRLTVSDLAGNTRTVTQTLRIDGKRPRVTVDGPRPDTTVSPEKAGVVTVSASDKGGLDRVAANLYDAANKKLVAAIGSTSASTPIGDAKWSGKWAFPQGLPDGEYTIRVAATDKAGNTTTTTRPVRVDGTPPAVKVSTAKSTVKVTATDAVAVRAIKARLYDASGDTRIASIGKATMNSAKASKTWSLPKRLPAGTYTVAVTVTDAAGHATTEEVSITRR